MIRGGIKMTTKYELQYIDMMLKCKSYRKCQKITQSEVADGMNVYQQDICKIEKCSNIPNVIKFLEYLDAIGLKIVLKEV